jgi:[acyl-carrier-protein] S-malonyltransferase
VESVEFAEPAFPVWANADAEPGREVGSALLEQLTAPVRFSASLASMADAGIRRFVHIGPGDVTAGLARKSIEDSEIHVVSNLEEAAAVAEAITG